jgi:hypothetical protein
MTASIFHGAGNCLMMNKKAEKEPFLFPLVCRLLVLWREVYFNLFLNSFLNLLNFGFITILQYA